MLPDRRKLTFQAKGPASRTSLRGFVLHGFPFATPVPGALVISDQLIPEAVYSGIKGAQAASGRRPGRSAFGGTPTLFCLRAASAPAVQALRRVLTAGSAHERTHKSTSLAERESK